VIKEPSSEVQPDVDNFKIEQIKNAKVTPPPLVKRPRYAFDEADEVKEENPLLPMGYIT
jgi:hypothetical protein